MTIGQHINFARLECNLTLDELAAMSNVSKSTIASWIYHDHYPTIDLLIRVADALEISLDKLVGRNYGHKEM